MSRRPAELLLGAGLLGLGACFGVATYLLPDAPGYAQVGPRLFPGLISGGMLVTGALLLKQALGAGFVNLPQEQHEPLDWRAFGWVSAGVLAHLALIAQIGFVAASALLFAATARGFGSRAPWRDALIGLALGAVVFVIFTRALTLSLPPGALVEAVIGKG